MASFDYLHQEFNLGANDVVRVSLDSQANVMLLDDSSYNSYRSGRACRGIGGRAIRTPVMLQPTHAGRWHLVLDLGGTSGTIRHSVSVLKG